MNEATGDVYSLDYHGPRGLLFAWTWICMGAAQAGCHTGCFCISYQKFACHDGGGLICPFICAQWQMRPWTRQESYRGMSHGRSIW